MIWKDVVGYEGIYQVSDTGEVRTAEGKKTHSVLHGERNWKQRTLKQKVSKDNNCRVCLYKDKKEKNWLVHRLVADAFISKVEGKNYINHIDGNRLNNCLSNLEWCDHTENNNHAFDNDLIMTGKKVVLVHRKTKTAHYFRSLSKASIFLGKNKNFIWSKLKKGDHEVEGYMIFVDSQGVNVWKS